ncbi:trichohyalin-like [Impatiens glandulifera]|uniref:trichohyalin-like n=1 Tax=Impatiens glandulifera TaxID=253017 RepID=UPI001FB19612|nr:trichohyalin-like [Impatiens glandulifera]
MPSLKDDDGDFDDRDCKIRKRGSSSSSSSSLVRNYRLKRAILAGKGFRSRSPLLLQSQNAEFEAPSFDAVEKIRNSHSNREKNHKTESKVYDGLKSQLKEVRNMLIASKELLKSLSHRICCQEKLEPSSRNNKPIVSALRFELDRARVQLDQLIEEDRSKCIHQFAKEKAEEEERMSRAMLRMAGEIEVEKKLRRQMERLNKSLGKELNDTKACLAKALEDLQIEKREKQELERKCNDQSRAAEVLEGLTREEEFARTAASEDDDVFSNSGRMEDKVDEMERYKMVRELKDHILFGSKTVYYSK